MCTVTYIPQPEGGFLFTSNRDEAPSRSAKEMASKKLENGVEIHFPRDSKAGGTWLAVSNDNRLICVLNGAFERHEHQPPYRLSRGIMALDFFEYSSAIDFFEEYEFEGIEPFTLVIVDDGNLIDFRWDGTEVYMGMRDEESCHIWSSAMLYPLEIKEKRETLFSDWLSTKESISKEDILDFHRNGKVGDPKYDLVMNRGELVRTVSITSVVSKDEQFSMEHVSVGSFQ